MQDDEQEPLMWTNEHKREVAHLVTQLHRLVAHYNDTHPGYEIDAARIEMHLPAFEVTVRYQVMGEPPEEHD